MARYHLAEVNIAVPKEPLDSELLTDFVTSLAPVNAVADTTPGFVWRLKTEDGDATAIRAFDDARIIVNMSVWESMEALRQFVYRIPAHVDVLRRRREWFETAVEMHMALWWVPAGHVPSVHEAEVRLGRLRAEGPTPLAFTFRQSFPSPDEATQDMTEDDRWLCPA